MNLTRKIIDWIKYKKEHEYEEPIPLYLCLGDSEFTVKTRRTHGMLTVLPLAWADYFGRASYGAIRGTALAVQVVAPAAGPLISGILRDYTGDYVWSLWVFVVFSILAILTALLIRVPSPPAH